MKKHIVTSLVVLFFVAGDLSLPSQSHAQSLQELQALISALQAQVQALQAQLFQQKQTVKTPQPVVPSTVVSGEIV